MSPQLRRCPLGAQPVTRCCVLKVAMVMEMLALSIPIATCGTAGISGSAVVFVTLAPVRLLQGASCAVAALQAADRTTA
jgi:hypothetical protein